MTKKNINELTCQWVNDLHPTSAQLETMQTHCPRGKPAMNLKTDPNKCRTVCWQLSFNNRMNDTNSCCDLMIASNYTEINPTVTILHLNIQPKIKEKSCNLSWICDHSVLISEASYIDSIYEGIIPTHNTTWRLKLSTLIIISG